MLDLRSIRENPEPARAALARRGAAEALDELLRLDHRRRELLPEVEERRARQNRASDQIAEAKRSGEDAEPLIAEMRQVSAEVKELEAELAEVESKPRRAHGATSRTFPTPRRRTGPRRTMPWYCGRWANAREFEFEVRDHLDLGLANGWIEMEKAGEASGSRFAYLLGDLVLVQLALVRLALELIGAEGFVPVVPPVLVREGPLFGTGFFPGEREMIYEIPRDELFLVGTSEVSLAALHAGEILAAGELPRRYAGLSTCFRREAGAAGKDTRGIFRVHQFDKVEMFSFVRPEESGSEHERILAIQERILQALEIPYRVVDIAGRRPGSRGGAQVRLRGVDPEPGALPRADFVLEHHRLPGAAPWRALPARARGPARAPSHAQRHGRRRRPNADRAARERAAPDGSVALPGALRDAGRRRKSAVGVTAARGGPRSATRPARRPPGPWSAHRS